MRYIIPISNVNENEVEKASMFGFGTADMIELWCKNPLSFEVSHTYQYIGKLNNAKNKLDLCNFYKEKGWFVDIDITKDFELINKVPRDLLILSFHDFDKVPDNLSEIVENMESSDPKIYKISVTVNTKDDLDRFLSWTKKVHQDHTFIFTTMGKFGSEGRIELWKERLSYAHFSPITDTEKTEDSQLTLDQWQSLF